MNETAAELAVHFAAAVHQADPSALTDSKSFMGKIAQLGPDTPGFVDRVSDAVRDAVAGAPLRAGEPPVQPVQAPVTRGAPGPQAAAAPVSPANVRLMQQATRRAELGPDYSGEVTVQDVQDAPAWVVAEWAQAGKLAGLGVPQQMKQRRR